jgi:hypothetical protein
VRTEASQLAAPRACNTRAVSADESLKIRLRETDEKAPQSQVSDSIIE